MSCVPQLAHPLASVSLRQPSPTEAGPWSICSHAALRFPPGLAHLWTVNKLQLLSLPPPPLPRKFWINSSINHLLLKPFYRAGSVVVSRPDCTPGSHQELNKNRSLYLVHMRRDSRVCLSASDNSVRKHFMRILKGKWKFTRLTKGKEFFSLGYKIPCVQIRVKVCT